MQNTPKRNNDRPRQADHSETLIIPHITKEMLELAKQMAAEGKSREEIAAAVAALQPAAAPVLQQAAKAGSGKAKRAQKPENAKSPRPWQRKAPRQTEVDNSKTIQMPVPPPVSPEQTVQTPQTPQTVESPQAAPAKPAKPAAEKPKKQEKSAKQPRHAAPRTREEAQVELSERIRADHIWLSNPVLVRGLGLAPIVGAAVDGQRALMLCLASLILITATRGIAVGICHLTKNRFRAPIYAYTAALLYIPTYILLYELFGTSVALLGIYLPILVVEPAIVKRMEFTELESISDAWRHGFNNGIGMCVALLLVGLLRELLATGAVFGRTVLTRALLPLAAQPAGGFILVGCMAAVWCAVTNAYTEYKREEVRRLYVDRKR